MAGTHQLFTQSATTFFVSINYCQRQKEREWEKEREAERERNSVHDILSQRRQFICHNGHIKQIQFASIPIPLSKSGASKKSLENMGDKFVWGPIQSGLRLRYSSKRYGKVISKIRAIFWHYIATFRDIVIFWQFGQNLALYATVSTFLSVSTTVFFGV